MRASTLCILLGGMPLIGAVPPAHPWAVGTSAPAVPFLLTRLELDLRVDYANGTIGGVASLTLRNTSKRPASTVPLLLGRLLTVSGVRSRSGAAVRYSQRFALFTDDSARQVNAITVRPARPVAPGDSITLAVHYGGTLAGYTETGSLYIRDHVDSAFTIIREDAYAFPTAGVLDSKADRAAPRAPFAFVAHVTVPPGQVVAMGGVATEPARRDSLVTWSSHSSAPVPFLNITIAPYRVLETTGARIFYFPADSDGARMVERAITAAMAKYAEWFGPLVQGATLTVMEIPDGFGSQASLTAGIMQTAGAFHEKDELRQLYHELSHLWNVEDTDHPSPRWNEGLASFLEYRMAAELDGWNDWTGTIDRWTQYAQRVCASPARCDSVPMARYGAAGMTDESYTTGMLMFYTLYEVQGGERFDQAYRDFFQAHQAHGSSTSEMAGAFRAAGGGSERILSDWLWTTHWHARLQAGESVQQMIDTYRAP
jgi:aminopeptidase N